MSTPTNIDRDAPWPRNLTDDELARAVVASRNRRDAFAAGREPADALTNLRRLLDEQARRRAERRAARNA